jgi:hypothetical protein
MAWKPIAIRLRRSLGSDYDNLDSHQCILIAMVMRVRNGLDTERTMLLCHLRERSSTEACVVACSVAGVYSNYLGTRAFGHAPIGHVTTVDLS